MELQELIEKKKKDVEMMEQEMDIQKRVLQELEFILPKLELEFILPKLESDDDFVVENIKTHQALKLNEAIAREIIEIFELMPNKSILAKKIHKVCKDWGRSTIDRQLKLLVESGQLKRIGRGLYIAGNMGSEEPAEVKIKHKYHHRLPNGSLDEPILEYFNKMGASSVHEYDVYNHLRSKEYKIKSGILVGWLDKLVRQGKLIKVQSGVYKASANFDWKETTR